ncbi:MAG: amidohydrolase [Firmicutes bacterium]|nr:amidohydrolase [Bacillota bacterium]
MDIRALAEKNRDYIIERRRYYHQHPELSFKEWETTKTLKADLEAMGMEIQTFEDYPGLIATLDTGKPGRTIMLRADIDALPVVEGTGLEFCSVNEGVMHACGHDAHLAMLLGAAKILTEVKDELCGKVKFILQSGEEHACGAKYYIEHGLMEGVDGIFGMHIWGTVDAPYICVEPGKRMASCDNFTIRVKGKQTHGSSPHLGHDAIVAASNVVMGLQGFVSRKNDPTNPLVVSVGKFHGGNMYNIICNDVELVGTIRTYSRELRKELEAELRSIAEHAAAVYGCTAEFELSPMLPAVINDNEEMNQIAMDAAVKLYGQEGLTHMDSLMGSEDFSLFMEQVPGFFAFIGAKNADKGIIYSNHHEKFTVDEDSLERGAALAAQFAVDFLNK